MKKHVLFYFALLSYFFGVAQCDSAYVFCTQEEIDSFQVNFGPCTEVYAIWLRDDCSYQNVDGFKELKHIDILKLSDKTGNNPISLHGFDSLISVGDLHYKLRKKHLNAFPSLDSVSHIFHEFRGDSRDLSMYSNVRHIKLLSTFFDGEWSGLENFEPTDSFNMRINNSNSPSNINTILKGVPSTMSSLEFSFSSNVILDGMEKYDSIGTLYVYQSTDLNLSPMSNISRISNLDIIGPSDRINFNGGFKNIKKLSILELIGCSIVDPREVVPNLEEVTCGISIYNNPLLSDVSLLSSLPIQKNRTSKSLPVSLRNRYLNIYSCPNLTTCTNKYVCSMVEKYPDSVLIFGNGQFCNSDYLQRTSCKTLSTYDDNSIGKINISPNPVNSTIYLEEEVDGYSIYNIVGKEVKSGTNSNRQIDVSDLKVGMYLIKVYKEGEGWRIGDFIKM